MRIEVPGLEIPELVLEDIHFTEYGRWLMQDYKPIAGGASIGNAVELKILDHITNQATYALPSAASLGLWTSAVDDTSTAATAGELSYT
jgi:hypothetical protein